MVEIFCKRSEIMPSDESVEQHDQKRAEEIADVDKDKSSPEGLFKGTFRVRPREELLFDESDGVFRCPGCHHEHEGGPLCLNCGTVFDGHHGDDNSYGFSDFDSEIDGDLELDDLELDVDEHYDEGHFHHFLGGAPYIHHFPLGPGHAHFHRHHHHHYDESWGGSSGDDSSEGSVNDDEDEGSLQDFVVRDEEPNDNQRLANGRDDRQPINISDESDEGGPVNSRRRANRPRVPPPRGPPSSTPSVASYLGDATESENGESNADADLLRHAGWSPLDTENETDDEEPIRQSCHGYDDEQNTGHESDTNTMRNEPSDDEDDASRDDMSETPNYHYNGERYIRDEGTPNSYDYDDQSEVDFPQSMDRDGDTEMSASPGPSISSLGGSINPYYYDEDVDVPDDSDNEGTPIARGHASLSTDGYGNMVGDLGVANEVHEIEGDSSETSIQPPPRRRPRQYRAARVQQTDPRISLMFAEHQLSLRGAQGLQAELDEFEIENSRAELASRNRRMTSYRLQPPRRAELRDSQSPSATRVISSTSRVARTPRQYQRRYH